MLMNNRVNYDAKTELNKEKLDDALTTLLFGFLYTNDLSLLRSPKSEMILNHFTQNMIDRRFNDIKHHIFA